MHGHTVIVGAGIVGLCIAYNLRKKGHKVTIVARDPLDASVSCINAGAIAAAEIIPLTGPSVLFRAPAWLLDPLGPLHVRWRHLPNMLPWMVSFVASGTARRREAAVKALATLVQPVFEDHRAMLRETGLSRLLSEKGSLFLYRSEKSRARDQAAWDLRRAHGISFEAVDRGEIAAREPALGREADCGYFLPDWAHYLDPQELILGLAAFLRSMDCEIRFGEVSDVEVVGGKPRRLRLNNGQDMEFDDLVVAAGAWSAKLSARLGDRFPLESQRGYNSTLPNPSIDLETYLTFAEDHFVLTPMSKGLRIGGAVEFGGLDSAPNFERSRALLRLAKRYLPDINIEGGTDREGHRPATPDDVPVISRSSNFDNVIYAFGHGHLGLTLGPTTGRLVEALITRTPSIDLTPYRIDRFC